MKKSVTGMLLLVLVLNAGAAGRMPTAKEVLATLKEGWDHPARTYRSHTRWWWPGNALTKEDITWQLEQMAEQGFGGVEIMSTWRMYEKGNIDYLSPEFLELVKHAVAEAKRLDMEVAITFSPGWSFGGPWVKKEDQSKVLCHGVQDLKGGTKFSGELPRPEFKIGKHNRHFQHMPKEDGSLVAVVAGKLNENGQLIEKSLRVLKPEGTKLEWKVPPGQWRLMAFWLKYTGQICQAQSFDPPAKVIDHMNKGAVQRYCDYLGGIFYDAVGKEFGKTVDSFFCDSFEIHPLPNSLLWSTDTLAGFKKHAGYDLTRYLPAIWYDIGPLTPRIRYDLGYYLHDLGLETVFKTMNDWCDAHHIQARIQPHYRFTPELVQAAGATARPETEVTTARFEPVADPRKATASGARFYGRDFISAEAYTFIHPRRYRTNLSDIKIATDAFLRDGVTQFYNHGYFASPEKHVAPTRDMPWANRISHWNTWWPYYHHVGDYVARCCYLLRQGKFIADVLIYTPQATAWSEKAIFGTNRRVMCYGNLAKTLVANGYDFDIVNDDLLQNTAKIGNGTIDIAGHTRRVIIMPRNIVVPIKTMRVIRNFAKAGGTVIALEELPQFAAGLMNYEANDAELRQIVNEVFSNGSTGIFLPEYEIDRKPFSPARQPYSVTPPLNDAQRRLLAVINRVIPPDFALAGRAQSDGLTFIHRQVNQVDVYFVCNLEPKRIKTDVTFRVFGKIPQRWDAITGNMSAVAEYREGRNGTTIPLEFEPWGSAFFLFAPGVKPSAGPVRVSAPSAVLPIRGPWRMTLAGYGFQTLETEVTELTDWTENPRTRHFSGTGVYETEFTIPADRWPDGARLQIDLGQVGCLADVELNGKPVGTAWMAPYRLDITGAAKRGKNRLVVKVTNTLINYVSGLKEPPEVPPELQPRLGKANPAIYPNSARAKKEMSETDLPLSGLVGPVCIKVMP